MGLWDVLFRRREARRARDGHAKERSGDLAGAVESFLQAGLADEAARVLLLRANAAPAAEQRLAFIEEALRVAEDPELTAAARRRKALIGYDLVKQTGSSLPSELARVGRELEEAGEFEPAADAFAMAGDREGEVRALTAAGAIERLESRLSEAQTEARHDQELSLLLRKLEDLDRTADRRAALELAASWLELHVDERVSDAVRGIRARVLRGPLGDFAVRGEAKRYALGDEITVGRSEATIVVASRAISRRHLRIYRGPNGPMVEDLETRNGTTLAGARLRGAIPVGEGLALRLGGEVPIDVRPFGSGVSVEVAGDVLWAPLGPLAVGGWSVSLSGSGGDEGSFVQLDAPRDARPYLGEYHVGPRVELAQGDALRATRDGEILLEVLGDGTSPGRRA